MKSLNRIYGGVSCLALLACSTAADPPSTGQAGASSSAAGMGSAGTPAAAAGGGSGSAATAGAPGTAGAATGGATGGSPSTGEAGGSAAGTGGVGSSSAGAGGAGGGAAGSGTAGSSGGSGPDVDTTLTGAFDGALLQYPCGSGNPNYDCAEPSPCSNASASQDAQVIKPSGGSANSWTMGGTPGTTYDVKVHIQGVVEPSWYHGGTRSAGSSSVDVASSVPGAKPYAKDLFQTGGTRLTFADNGNGFDYNSYELSVTPAGGSTPSLYFLNSVIPNENPHTSSKTGHFSFEIDEMPTLKIPAGATIALTVRDSNCTLVQNCGTSNNNMCGNGARVVPFTGSQPAPPSSWTGKTTSGSGGNLNGQFVHFDVISVTVAQ